MLKKFSTKICRRCFFTGRSQCEMNGECRFCFLDFLSGLEKTFVSPKKKLFCLNFPPWKVSTPRNSVFTPKRWATYLKCCFVLLHERASEVYYGRLSFFLFVSNSQNMRSLPKYALKLVHASLLPVKIFFTLPNK